MNRTRLIFVVFIAATLFIVWRVTTYYRPSQRAEQRTEQGAEPPEKASQGSTQSSKKVVLTIASSNTKESWIDQVVTRFNAQNKTIASGEVIVAEVSHVTSGGSMKAILEGNSKPVVWSPGDQSWVAQMNDYWRQRTNRPLISQDCPATIYAPLGFAMWRPMAEAIGWPDKKIGWDTITELAADPEGWARYGHPEWGQFRFGHTHPGYANSGLLSMTAFVYGIVGSDTPLTADKVYQAEKEMRALEYNTAKYGSQAPALLELMAIQGPSYLHAAAVPEANMVQYNIEDGDRLRFPLAFIFPAGGTIWADHPYCTLDNADWVHDAQKEAAAIFRDYLLEPAQQELAIDNFLRPLDTSIPLHAPLDLEHGTDPRITPEIIRPLPSPDAEVSAAVIDLFRITKRKAAILVVLDISGSMKGKKIRKATEATATFLKRLHPEDTVGALTFSNAVTTLSELSRAGDVVEELSNRVSMLIADSNTTLYAAVCQASNVMETLRKTDVAAGRHRLYGIVLLSDGEDTVGEITENQMFTSCLPKHAEADGVKIFPIAFGEEANTVLLKRIADVTGGRLFTADPDSIDQIYLRISAEQ